MIRTEIIANQSVQDDIVEILESSINGFYYTIIPLAHGRGKQGRRLETNTWPEANFVLIAYVDNRIVQVIKKSIGEVKKKFHDEGIKLFFMKADY